MFEAPADSQGGDSRHQGTHIAGRLAAQAPGQIQLPAPVPTFPLPPQEGEGALSAPSGLRPAEEEGCPQRKSWGLPRLLEGRRNPEGRAQRLGHRRLPQPSASTAPSVGPGLPAAVLTPAGRARAAAQVDKTPPTVTSCPPRALKSGREMAVPGLMPGTGAGVRPIV